METVHAWVKETYQSQGIAEPALPTENRAEVAGPALEDVFVLGKGFLNFDNAPYSFVPGQVRQEHPAVLCQQ